MSHRRANGGEFSVGIAGGHPATRLAEGLPADGDGAWANLETRGIALAGVGRATEALTAIDECLGRARGAGAPARDLARLASARAAIESGTPLWTMRQ